MKRLFLIATLLVSSSALAGGNSANGYFQVLRPGAPIVLTDRSGKTLELTNGDYWFKADSGKKLLGVVRRDNKQSIAISTDAGYPNKDTANFRLPAQDIKQDFDVIGRTDFTRMEDTVFNTSQDCIGYWGYYCSRGCRGIRWVRNIYSNSLENFEIAFFSPAGGAKIAAFNAIPVTRSVLRYSEVISDCRPY